MTRAELIFNIDLKNVLFLFSRGLVVTFQVLFKDKQAVREVQMRRQVIGGLYFSSAVNCEVCYSVLKNRARIHSYGPGLARDEGKVRLSLCPAMSQ